MGLPTQDAHYLLPHVAIISRSPDEASFQAAMGVIMGYIEDRLVERQQTPKDDFLSRLLSARIGERMITPHEVRATAINVLLGGLDTVTASMGFFMKFLAENPDHRRQLVDNPAIIPTAVEELLRRHGIFNTARLVLEDFDFHGTTFRANDLVMVPTVLYNVDEARFPDPLAVDFDRKDKGHMTFASGIHRCLGQNFARIQLHLLLQEWLARIPDFATDPQDPPVVQSGRANTVRHLPLVW
jgi:cytochrome P450